MSIEVVADMMQEALFLVLKTAAPPLIVSLVIGLCVSIFQTVTSIQEQTLTFVPKILAIFLSIMLLGHWILVTITDYIVRLWSDFNVYVK